MTAPRGLFDDLYPSESRQAIGGLFDDLYPQAEEKPVAPPSPDRPRASWLSTQVRANLAGLAQTGLGLAGSAADVLDVITPARFRSQMGPRFRELGQRAQERLRPQDESRQAEYEAGVTGARMGYGVSAYGGAGKVLQSVPQVVSALGRGGAAAAGGFGLGAVEDVAATPETSLPGLAAGAAERFGAEDVAGVLRGLAATPGGRALTGAAVGAVPDVALDALGRFSRRARVPETPAPAPTAPRALPPGQYEMGPVTTRLEPETDPRRMLPSTTARPTDVGPLQGPGIPLTASAEQLTRAQLEATPEDIAQYIAARNRGVIPSRTGQTFRRPTSIDRAIADAERAAIQADVAGKAAERFPTSLRKLSDEDLRATAQAWQERLERTVAEANILDETEAIRFQEEFGTTRLGYRRAKRLTGAGEEARRYARFSEEQLGRMEELGLTPDDLKAWREASKRLPKVQEQFGKLMDEMGRRGLSFVDESTDFPFGMNRPGVIAPELLAQGGGAVLGAGTGVATAPEGEDPFGLAGRALIGGLAGRYGGQAALLAATRGGKRPVIDPNTPEGRVLGTINTGERGVKTPVREQARALKDRLYTDYISETAPLVRAARAAGGEAGEARMLGAIAQLHGHQRAAQQYLDDMVGAPLRNIRGQEDAVRALLKARRDLDIRTRGGAAKSAADMADLESAVARLSQNPSVVQAADAINAMHRDLLQKRYAAGLLTEDAYNAIRQSEDFYTPFVREYADEVAASGAGGGRLNVRTSGVRRMDRDVESIANTADPLEVAMTAAERTYRDVARQRIQNFVVEMAESGQLPPVRRVVGTPSRNARTFDQIVGGERIKYEVTDPDLYDVIAGVDNDTAGTIQRMMRAYTSIGRTAITMLPDFAVANLMRDIGQAAPQTLNVARSVRETAMGAGAGAVLGAATTDEDESMLARTLQGAGFGAGVGGFARPVTRTLKAVSEVATNAENFKEYLRAGGSTEGFNVRTPKDAREALRALQRSGVELSDVINPKRWVDALQWIGSVGEQATRLAKYEEAIAAGRSVPEAAYLAQDVSLRFRNIGRSTKGIASITKFWNAKVQGWDKLQRMVRDPKTAGLATAMVTAPTVALWSVNKDNPYYWDRPQWERNLFWLVPKAPGSPDFWRIPKPFEFGYLFASLPERMLDFAAQRGDIPSAAQPVAEPGRELGRAARDMALSTMEGAFPVPDVVSSGLQLAQGRDWFRNRPIVSRPSLPAPMQVGEQTSAIARQAGRLGASPEMVDFAIGEALGSSGRIASRAADVVARRMGAPAPDVVAQGPMTPGIPQRFQTKQYAMTDREAGARDRLRSLDEVWAGYQNLIKSRDPEAIQRYITENRAELDAHQALDGARRALDQATNYRRQVTRNPVLTPEQRRAQLDAIRQQAADVSSFIQSFKPNR